MKRGEKVIKNLKGSLKRKVIVRGIDEESYYIEIEEGGRIRKWEITKEVTKYGEENSSSSN